MLDKQLKVKDILVYNYSKVLEAHYIYETIQIAS